MGPEQARTTRVSVTTPSTTTTTTTTNMSKIKVVVQGEFDQWRIMGGVPKE
jgi:hypothetical protein